MDPLDLARRLRELPPREARLISWRLLEGRTRHQCAELLGVTPEAFDVALRRALSLLDTPESAPPPEVFSVEAAQASKLSAALEEHDTPGRSPSSEGDLAGPDLVRLLALARALVETRLALRQRLDELDEVEARSPRGKRALWLRRLAALAVLAVSSYLYFRRAPTEDAAPSRPTRDFRR